MRKGFTLMETLVVIGLIATLAAVSLPFYTLFQGFSAIEAISFEVKENIRLAQTYAMTGKNNSNWGVYITGNTYTVYKGSTYILRDSSEDRVFETPSNIILSGINDVNFLLKTGAPNVTPTISILNTDNQAETNISINSIGLID